ncbi:hypothetical protein Glove_84g91 [Diversispora epigaea]|uniref:Uncharacterized protein n=1 Tax=Diversispora epigaea TaxID=1348612 RepID=A0A397JGE1_9GLOM|nr:hypothetical protein Glove_84g91 [Diversispora epigaea]
MLHTIKIDAWIVGRETTDSPRSDKEVSHHYSGQLSADFKSNSMIEHDDQFSSNSGVMVNKSRENSRQITQNSPVLQGGKSTKEHFIREFKTWSSGNANADKIIQEFQINNKDNNLHIADGGGHGSVHSAELENGTKSHWNLSNMIGNIIKIVIDNEFIAKYYEISKNPSTQNNIIVMDLFKNLRWKSKIELLLLIACGLVVTAQRPFSYQALFKLDVSMLERCPTTENNTVHNDVMLRTNLNENQEHTSRIIARVCTLLEEGYPSHYVARRENISQSTVIKIKQRKDRTGTFKNRPKSGCLRLL